MVKHRQNNNAFVSVFWAYFVEILKPVASCYYLSPSYAGEL